MLARPTPSPDPARPPASSPTAGRSFASPADAALFAALVRAARADGHPDGYVEAPALSAVATYARRARAAGRSPRQLSVAIRQSLAAAAPAAMTVGTFDTVARSLVRHALQSYFFGEDD